MARTDPIYVEIRIRAPLDELWEKTQVPELHRRWDLRFTSIEPLGGSRFRYATRIGLGFEVAGEGESAGERRADDGSATSALRFWSEDPRALIREGSGYWRYVPTTDGVRFITQYDYETRWGETGRAIDHVAFRPLLGWATAWSFDRLRLWVESGISPEDSLRRLLPRASRCLRKPPR
jgi:hypothetical protein